LICDLAQTYGVFNYKELSPSLVATLAMGLPEDSRVKKKLSGQKLTLEQSLLALLLDDFNLFLWSRQKHRGSRPKSIFKELTEEKKPKDELMAFESIEDFNEWLKRKQEKRDG
jgi:hypothetical protein